MKKLISILLLLTMMLAVLVACSTGGDGNDSETTKANGDDGTTAAGETENTDKLPDRDFEGYNFRWLSIYNPAGEMNGIVVDEGEVVDETSIAYQAKVERDSEIVDRFNIKFVDVSSGHNAEIVSYVIKDALNPESSFDVGAINAPDNVSQVILNDLIYDANEIPHLQLEKDWYLQQANEEYQILGKQYFVAGAFPDFPGTCNLFFNKDMVLDNNLPLPYDTIIEGGWTLEEMMKYTSAAYKDIGPAGIDKDDIFGYASHPSSIGYFYQGMGGLTTTRNDKGEIVPVFSNDKVDAIFTKVKEFYDDSSNYSKDNDAKVSHQAFYDGNAMFCYWVTGTLNPYKIDAFERGLAILPKFDVDQERYYTPAISGGLKLFPANIADIEPVGYIYEALCEATLRIVYPQTIQEAVDYEELTDKGSIEVKKIIDKSLMFDILKNCDPTGGQLTDCGFIMSCVYNNTTPAIMEQSVKATYEQIFTNFFQLVAEK